ncbi:holo-[acyl-carrier-protein] synthase KNAG_0J01640 [Huiozyma naganishii CBS 8797]|uniref:4'-phosphopantetheinyl transferase domain-containing protein n=1 Tax=Huiozyma naganishii (strain ATCC MYA-139 / BCRC 22969 / CBS 8797 / KCTC 17520 / NBRC 10181 / NCYC 3082 / Yp74L-3) TaxID=1071383 RepID=J7RBI8_HUIN7|nr:hypothetical protein KNAG_0J01640 [Kazachstania naganishii CBS 8797]CCK72245.1 hypothetical protein KNAG_0J01640 [Kazachstania naganishii CBS 8797]
MLGIGVDLVYLPRISKLIAKYKGSSTLNAICGKFMCAQEQAHMGQLLLSGDATRTVQYMAGVWAAKEAVYKALSCFVPSNALPPAQTVYSQLMHKHNVGKCPTLSTLESFPQLYPQHEQFYSKYILPSRMLLSISHDGDYLIAYTTVSKK